MILLCFINSGLEGSSMRFLLTKRLKKGSKRNPASEEEYRDEIQDCEDDKNYVPTISEIFELFTLNKMNSK